MPLGCRGRGEHDVLATSAPGSQPQPQPHPRQRPQSQPGQWAGYGAVDCVCESRQARESSEGIVPAGPINSSSRFSAYPVEKLRVHLSTARLFAADHDLDPGLSQPRNAAPVDEGVRVADADDDAPNARVDQRL